LTLLGRSNAAAAEAAAARDELDALGATREAARAARALRDANAGTPLSDLTRRELEVLRLVAQGLNDDEIADRLVLSPHTVHRHVANARTKLGLRSRAAAVAYAARSGLI